MPIFLITDALSKFNTVRLPLQPAGKKTYKHHVFAPTADARCMIFPKLCTVIELVEAINEGVIHFSIQPIVFPTGCTEKFGLIDRRAVSQQ